MCNIGSSLNSFSNARGVQENRSSINFKGIHDWVAMGKLDELRQHLELYGDMDIETRDSRGRTPLMVAVELDRFEMIQYLLEKGADVNARDFDGVNVAEKAMLGDHEIGFYTLIRYSNIETWEINPNLKNENGLTLVEKAFMHNSLEELRVLLRRTHAHEWRIDPNKKDVWDGLYTIAEIVLLGGDLEIIDMLKGHTREEEWVIDLNSIRGGHSSIAQSSFEYGDVKKLERFLKYLKIEDWKVDPNGLDYRGVSVVENAIRREDTIFVEQLEKCTRVKDWRINPNAKNKEGLSLLEESLMKGEFWRLDLLAKYTDVDEWEINPNARVRDGRSLVEKAIGDGDMELLERLKKYTRVEEWEVNPGRNIHKSTLERCVKSVGQEVYGAIDIDRVRFPLIVAQNGCTAFLTLEDGTLYSMDGVDAKGLRAYLMGKKYGKDAEIAKKLPAVFGFHANPGHPLVQLQCESCDEGKSFDETRGYYPGREMSDGEVLLGRSVKGHLRNEDQYAMDFIKNKNTLLVRFFLEESQAEKVVGKIRSIERSCKENPAEDCLYHLLGSNCVDKVQEIFGTIGGGYLYDYLTEDQSRYYTDQFSLTNRDAFDENKALAYGYIWSRGIDAIGDTALGIDAKVDIMRKFVNGAFRTVGSGNEASIITNTPEEPCFYKGEDGEDLGTNIIGETGELPEGMLLKACQLPRYRPVFEEKEAYLIGPLGRAAYYSGVYAYVMRVYMHFAREIGLSEGNAQVLSMVLQGVWALYWGQQMLPLLVGYGVYQGAQKVGLSERKASMLSAGARYLSQAGEIYWNPFGFMVSTFGAYVGSRIGTAVGESRVGKKSGELLALPFKGVRRIVDMASADKNLHTSF